MNITSGLTALSPSATSALLASCLRRRLPISDTRMVAYRGFPPQRSNRCFTVAIAALTTSRLGSYSIVTMTSEAIGSSTCPRAETASMRTEGSSCSVSSANTLSARSES